MAAARTRRFRDAAALALILCLALCLAHGSAAAQDQGALDQDTQDLGAEVEAEQVDSGESDGAGDGEGDAALASAECPEPVTVARFDWPEAAVAAELARRVLEDAFGCDVSLLPASAEPALAAIAAGEELIVAPGVALSQTRGQPEIESSRLFGAAADGWFAPAWMLERDRKLRSVLDAVADPSQFAHDGRRPRLHICPETWPCHAENRALIARLGLEDVFEIVTPASGDALIASIAAAFADQAPWIGYAWRPAGDLAAYPLRRLATSGIEICGGEGSEDGACRPPFAEHDPQTAYPPRLKETAPEVAAFLQRFIIPSDWMAEALTWRNAQDATARATADRLIEQRPEMWRAWLTPRGRAQFEAAR